jgi:hypothetical protein
MKISYISSCHLQKGLDFKQRISCQQMLEVINLNLWSSIILIAQQSQ